MWTLNRDDISHPTDAYGRLPVLGPETRADRCAFIVIGSAMFDGKAVGHLAVTGLLLACLLVRCQIVGMSVRSRDTKFPESFNSLKKKSYFSGFVFQETLEEMDGFYYWTDLFSQI